MSEPIEIHLLDNIMNKAVGGLSVYFRLHDEQERKMLRHFIHGVVQEAYDIGVHDGNISAAGKEPA